MVKFVVLGLSICVATLAGSYAHKHFADTQKGDVGKAGHDAKDAGTLNETDLLALPVIVDGELDGFFFLRLAYTSEPISSSIPTDLLLTDGFYQFTAKAAAGRPKGFAKVDIDDVAEGVKLAVNALAGKTVLSQIFVTQIDFFAGNDVRKKSIERRLVLKEGQAKQAQVGDAHAAPVEAGHVTPAH